jgi:alkanesulfonate monooxygenase SsuD/methylene tetrahydromethanopterin reductase-like flavin-dependent oxidoreductase (luciferase family)
MQFSMIFEAQLNHPTPERERQCILDCVSQAVLGEQVGFDRVWAVEHHALRWYAHMSAPEIFLTYIAAKTSTIRIGHGVVCMPFQYNHPVRVAERAAMLDILSGGRLDLGAGRGAPAPEMSLFGVEADRTPAEVEEALRIIANVWREDTFEWHGLLDIDPHPVLPSRSRSRTLPCSWPPRSRTASSWPRSTASDPWCSGSPGSTRWPT